MAGKTYGVDKATSQKETDTFLIDGNTFLAPLRYVQLLQHLLAETCEGRLSWVLDCFLSIVFGREARAVLRAI